MKTLLLCTSLAALVLAPAYGQDLNDTSQKKITVRSEIQRGINAVKAADAKAASNLERLGSHIKRMEEVDNRTNQENTDTDGFRLGAALGRFYLTDLASSIQYPNGEPKKVVPRDADETLKQIEILGDYTFASLACQSSVIEIKALSARLHLSDDQLSDLLGVRHEYLPPRIASWAARVPPADFQRKAIELYPDLGVAGSVLNHEFVARINRYKTERPEALADPAWPVNLAAECVSRSTEVAHR